MPVPVIKLSLRDQIVEQLRSDVLCGRLAEGDKLNEADLARQFGVSRTPVREALHQLTFEGLVDLKPNAGVKVSQMPPDSIRELVVPIRRRVETFALRMIYGSLGEEDFRRMEEILEKMRKACVERDFPLICEQDIAFHRFIIRRCGMSDVEAIWNSILSRIRTHFSQTHKRDYPDPMAIHEEHVRIVDVFRQGDLDASIEALGKNIA